MRSIISQELPVQEILLLDDNPTGSILTDALAYIAKKYPGTRLVSLGGNGGVSKARNAAVGEAAGEYIAYLDDDDEWLPEKIRIQMDLAREHPDAGLIFGIGTVVNPDGTTRYTWSESIFKPNPSFSDMLANDHVGSASHPMIRKDVLKTTGGFLEDRSLAVEDYEFWLRISQHWPLWGTDHPLYRKYMPEGEHVSRNFMRTFRGMENIYQEFSDAYAADRDARNDILYNVIRQGVKARSPKALLYVPAWLAAGGRKPARKAKREREESKHES